MEVSRTIDAQKKWLLKGANNAAFKAAEASLSLTNPTGFFKARLLVRLGFLRQTATHLFVALCE
jgi:hypothetical protein